MLRKAFHNSYLERLFRLQQLLNNIVNKDIVALYKYCFYKFMLASAFNNNLEYKS